MKKLLAIEVTVFFACIALFGTITGDYFRGWSVDLAYGAIALYPLYLARNTINFGSILMTFGLWAFGRVFQYADAKAMFTYFIASYGLLAIYHVKHDNYRCAKLAGATAIYGVVFAAVNPVGALWYVMQLACNLMYAALLIMPVSHGEEKSDGHRHPVEEEDYRKAA